MHDRLTIDDVSFTLIQMWWRDRLDETTATPKGNGKVPIPAEALEDEGKRLKQSGYSVDYALVFFVAKRKPKLTSV